MGFGNLVYEQAVQLQPVQAKKTQEISSKNKDEANCGFH